MKTPAGRLLSGIMILLIFASLARAGDSVSRILERSSPSVVGITAIGKGGEVLCTGSGFFISSEGDIVTNHHVLAGCAEGVIRTSDGSKGRILRIIRDDPDLDLLIAKTSLRNRVPLELGDSNSAEPGEQILVIGTSEGIPGTLSIGTVTDVKRAEGIKLLQITAPLLPGWSGSPVISSSGRVIAVATAFLNLGSGYYFALPVNYLKGLPASGTTLPDLPPKNTVLKAEIREEALTGVLVMHDQGDPEGTRSTGEREEKSHSARQSPGLVHFKNGKSLLCDRAWSLGSTVFLVVHGRRFAVGYDRERIDMERSFRLPL